MVLSVSAVGETDNPWFGFSKNGQNIRATNLLVAVWFIFFSIPLIKSMRDESVKIKKNIFQLLNDSLNQLKKTYRQLNDYQEISKFLII